MSVPLSYFETSLRTPVLQVPLELVSRPTVLRKTESAGGAGEAEKSTLEPEDVAGSAISRVPSSTLIVTHFRNESNR